MSNRGKSRAERAQERLEAGGKVLAYRAGGIVAPASRVNANKGIPGPSVGNSVCRCGQCNEIFGSVSAFDLHQTLDLMGNVVCWEPESIGMPRDKYRRWVTALDTRDHKPT